MSRCVWCVLVVLGVVLLAGAVLPVAMFVRIPEPYETAFISSKLVMLPVGALLLAAAAGLSARRARMSRR